MSFIVLKKRGSLFQYKVTCVCNDDEAQEVYSADSGPTTMVTGSGKMKSLPGLRNSRKELTGKCWRLAETNLKVRFSAAAGRW